MFHSLPTKTAGLGTNINSWHAPHQPIPGLEQVPPLSLLSTYHDVPIHASRYLRLYDTYRACIPLNCWSFMPSPSFYLPHPLSFPSTPPPLYRLFFPMTAVVPTAVLVPAISMCAFPTVTTINPHLYPHPRGMHSSSMSIAMLATRDPL